MNYVMLVGRIVNIVDREKDDELKKCVNLAIARYYKNNEGYYDTDFIPCYLTNVNKSTVLEYCEKGDVIGVYGTIESDYKGNIYVIANRIAFIKAKEKNNED